MNKPVYGTTYEYQHRFSREITDGIPLESTSPLRVWGKDIITAVCVIAFMVAAFYAANGIAALIQSVGR